MGFSDDDLDLDMAEIKRLSQDVHSFIHALATRLDASLPAEMLTITKKKKMFSSRETVQSVAVTVNDKLFYMGLENGRLVTTINKQVNNIVLSHSKCTVREWFSSLGEELKSAAGYHEEAADLLADFLV